MPRLVLCVENHLENKIQNKLMGDSLISQKLVLVFNHSPLFLKVANALSKIGAEAPCFCRLSAKGFELGSDQQEKKSVPPRRRCRS